MEWPKSATYGWNLREWKELEHWLFQNFGQRLFWTEIHGCMHGLQDSHGTLINKPWYVLTTDYDFYTQATLKCDGGHEHRQIVGLGSEAVHNTSYYPESMVKRIVQIWKRQWYHMKHAEITRELFVQCTHDEEKQRLIEEMDNLSGDCSF